MIDVFGLMDVFPYINRENANINIAGLDLLPYGPATSRSSLQPVQRGTCSLSASAEMIMSLLCADFSAIFRNADTTGGVPEYSFTL